MPRGWIANLWGEVLTKYYPKKAGDLFPGIHVKRPFGGAT